MIGQTISHCRMWWSRAVVGCPYGFIHTPGDGEFLAIFQSRSVSQFAGCLRRYLRPKEWQSEIP
jgi:hypothetical protein